MVDIAFPERLDRKFSLATVPFPSDPDHPLVARLAAGDETALRELMNRHGGRLRQIARRMNGGDIDADDIVQEAFVAVWRRAPKLLADRTSGMDRAPFGAYLTRIVVNRSIDRARRARFWRMIGIETAPEMADEAPALDDALVARSEVAAVASDLQILPARQRAAILLASSEERSVGEVAEAMGISIGAVEQLLVRARRTLRSRALARLQAGEAPAEEDARGR